MHKSRTATLSVFSLFVSVAIASACVTVNVNFPESAVQKATDDYVRELYRTAPAAEPAQQKKSPTPSTSLLDWALPSAYADATDGTFRVQSARASEIKSRMASRLNDVLAQKRAGAIGETNDGLLVVKSPEKTGKLLLKKVEKLVADDNADRKSLYAEVLKNNGLDSGRQSSIQRSFARSFQAESPSGTWVQGNDGNWSRKP